MKILKNKLKKSSKVMKFFYFVTFIFYWASFAFLCKSILSLTGIETMVRTILLILFFLYGLIFTLFGLTKLIEHKKVSFIVLTIFTIFFGVFFSCASFYIDKFYNKLENITSKDTSIYTTALVSLSNTSSIEKVGMITDESDRTGYLLPMEYMKNENLDYEILYYSNYTELLVALYNKEVDAIFITKDYVTIYSGEEQYQNIATETKIVKEYQKEMKTEESELLVSTKSLTEPFTVLVLGVDSDSSSGLDANAAFNGDTLILITFNPKTLNATMFSIPRDMYVPIISSYGKSIGYNKINSSAAYGTASTINTIENLTGIEIDYFVKVNFKGVIDLVDSIGGIDVDVEAPDYNYYISQWGEGVLCESDENRTYINPVCMNTGLQHLNGKQALAYARNRHGYLESDIARNRHQQQIIEAIAKKLSKTSSLSEFESLLDTISNNIATNMTTSKILSFYQSLKGMLTKALNGDDFISIQKTQLSYFSFQNQYGLDCLGYYEDSLDAIVEAMKENLELEETKVIKTFQYDYSDDYEQSSEIIGKGIYSGGKVPDSSITDAYKKLLEEQNQEEEEETEEENNETTEEEQETETNTEENQNETTTEEENNEEEEETNTNEEISIPGSPTEEEQIEN